MGDECSVVSAGNSTTPLRACGVGHHGPGAKPGILEAESRRNSERFGDPLPVAFHLSNITVVPQEFPATWYKGWAGARRTGVRHFGFPRARASVVAV